MMTERHLVHANMLILVVSLVKCRPHTETAFYVRAHVQVPLHGTLQVGCSSDGQQAYKTPIQVFCLKHRLTQCLYRIHIQLWP